MQLFFNILHVFGAVALFIFGMKTMSDAVQRGLGKTLQSYLNRMTRNNVSGVFSGMLFTSIIQSSSAVSVLTLSFVNAGTLSLKRAFSIIIGANIGTTLTLWLVILGFDWKIGNLALPIIAIALPFLLVKNQKFKTWSKFAIGFALIFIGLNFFTESLPNLTHETQFYNYLNKYAQSTSLGIALLFVLIGVVATIIIQSSSTFTILVALMLAKGFPLELAMMLVVGANVGTTFTAQLAATIGNIQTKIVTMFHTLFNVIGAVIFIIAIPLMISFFQKNIEDEEITLAIFHTVFNIVTAIIVLPFVNLLVLKSHRWVKNRQRNKPSLKLINSPLGPVAKIYITEAKREVSKFAGITNQIISQLNRLLTESNKDKFKELNERIHQLEKESDELENNVLVYLKSIYNYDLNNEDFKNIQRLMDVCHHLENVADSAIKTANIQRSRRESHSFITPRLRNKLLDLQEALSSLTTILIQNLSEDEDYVNVETAKQSEERLNQLHEEAEKELIKSIDKDKLATLSALYYKDLIQNYEVIGEHLYKANLALSK